MLNDYLEKDHKSGLNRLNSFNGISSWTVHWIITLPLNLSYSRNNKFSAVLLTGESLINTCLLSDQTLFL